MNRYRELTERHQKRIDAFLSQYAFFAFSEKQFAEGLQRLGITEEDAGEKLVRMSSTGGFMLKDRAAEYWKIAQEITDEISAAVHDPDTGRSFAYDMFYYELANHEYSYTGCAEDALDALGYEWEDIQKDEVLKSALEQAEKDVIRDAV